MLLQLLHEIEHRHYKRPRERLRPFSETEGLHRGVLKYYCKATSLAVCVWTTYKQVPRWKCPCVRCYALSSEEMLTGGHAGGHLEI
jgi:hypothetical protein